MSERRIKGVRISRMQDAAQVTSYRIISNRYVLQIGSETLSGISAEISSETIDRRQTTSFSIFACWHSQISKRLLRFMSPILLLPVLGITSQVVVAFLRSMTSSQFDLFIHELMFERKTTITEDFPWYFLQPTSGLDLLVNRTLNQC